MEKKGPDDPSGSLSPKQRLDNLFTALKRQRDPDQASLIADQINAELSDSGSATINLLMQWADKAIQEKRNAAAMDYLDQVISLKPDYVEGWNRRATLNFAIGDYRKSMEDINQVLRIEPRHFGALAGMAAILTERDNDALALRAWERFLEVYPANRSAQEEAGKLSEKVAGSRT
ncbi:tetratricopeptide (TPR) repeat protein [Rhizobium sp. BK347]|nr:tetratricopeptide (TPR) repeat protein [Rhizobium sp. BK252]MBB3404812.1 tetratricopeptide (TPR) repeat protein [Rhizobium sp. BK289]MBB3417310.1 tetratricopeptide (TPR) repeat protein [Rhizobium sp. BK284]MBB3485387.1 tetratricopeptide (TPR) repeat protein [Rhizobium sp. BK347]